MKLLISGTGHIVDFAPNIEFGNFEGEDKWKLSDSEGVILHYLIGEGITMVEVLDDDIPADFTQKPGKYLYSFDTETLIANPDYVPYVDPLGAVNEIAAITFVILSENGTIDPVTASEHIDVFSDWEANQHYTVNNLRKYNGTLYKCILEHDSQETWTPDVSPSLWVRTSDPAEEWPEWSQPIGATDAYSLGDKVSHNNQHWVSNVNANTWEPGVYGWDLVPEA